MHALRDDERLSHRFGDQNLDFQPWYGAEINGAGPVKLSALAAPISHTITFSEFSLGAINPTFHFSDNNVHTIGEIVSDGAQPASPVIAANSSYLGPVFVFFDNPVKNVSVNVGYFDNIGSTRIEFWDAHGHVLSTQHNTGFGVETFSFTSGVGIGAVVAIDESFDAAGFSLDTVVFGGALDTPDAPSVAKVANGGQVIDRNFGALGSTSFSFSDALGAGDSADYITFTAAAGGTATITTFLEAYPNAPLSFTINVNQGLNTFRILPGADYAKSLNYTLNIDLSLNGDPEDKAVDEWINDKLADTLGTVFSFQESKFDLFAKIMANVKNTDDAVKFLEKTGQVYAFLGAGLDLANRTDAIVHASDYRRELFVQSVDMLVGILATEAVGAGVSFVGTPLVGVLGGFAANIVYSYALSDNVKTVAGQWFDSHLDGVSPQMAGMVEAVAASIVTFDTDYYLATYADARAAVEGGEIANAYLHYLTFGAAHGYKPNAADPAIPVSEIVGAAGADASLGFQSSVFTTAAGSLVGDKLSADEASFIAYLNGQRTAGTEFGVDAILTTVANRIAHDWAVNNPTSPDAAFNRTAIDEWAAVLSNGRNFHIKMDALDGVPAGYLDGARVLGVYSSELAAANLFEAFTGDPSAVLRLLGIENASIGVGEYGGVWIVVLSPYGAGAAPAAESGPIETNLFGSEDRDILMAGAGQGFLYGRGGSDDLIGGKFADLLAGDAGDDLLLGKFGADNLVGGAGNDTLDGGGGADTMAGGNGNDTYIVDNAADITTEASAAGGIDLVKSSVTRTLGANLENLTLTGTAPISGVGNGLANTLIGNSAINILLGGNGADTINGALGADSINGGGGHDVMSGGAGADKFVFNVAAIAANSDIITDFTHNSDKIQLANSVFTALGAVGTLADGAFFNGPDAHDPSDRIIYNPADGSLFYDANGSASGGKVLIATLDAHLTISASDFQVI